MTAIINGIMVTGTPDEIALLITKMQVTEPYISTQTIPIWTTIGKTPEYKQSMGDVNYV